MYVNISFRSPNFSIICNRIHTLEVYVIMVTILAHLHFSNSSIKIYGLWLQKLLYYQRILTNLCKINQRCSYSTHFQREQSKILLMIVCMCTLPMKKTFFKVISLELFSSEWYSWKINTWAYRDDNLTF